MVASSFKRCYRTVNAESEAYEKNLHVAKLFGFGLFFVRGLMDSGIGLVGVVVFFPVAQSAGDSAAI